MVSGRLCRCCLVTCSGHLEISFVNPFHRKAKLSSVRAYSSLLLSERPALKMAVGFGHRCTNLIYNVCHQGTKCLAFNYGIANSIITIHQNVLFPPPSSNGIQLFQGSKSPSLNLKSEELFLKRPFQNICFTVVWEHSLSI